MYSELHVIALEKPLPLHKNWDGSWSTKYTANKRHGY